MWSFESEEQAYREYKRNLYKAYKKADALITKAKEYRDRRGYRENLGYDSIYKLEEYISPMNFRYQDECKIKQYFFDECRKI